MSRPEDSQDPNDASGYVSEVMSGTVNGAIVGGAPGAMVVYGGLRVDPAGDGYEVLDRGVIVDEDGVRSAFSTDAHLVDADLVVLDDRAVVAGRSCDGHAEIGDLGVSCMPGTATVRVIDLATGEASNLPLLAERADADGAGLFVEVYDVGGRLVVRVIHAGGVDTLLAADDFSSVEIISEDQRPGPVCATGDVLVERSAGTDPDRDLPVDPTEWSDLDEESILLRFLDLRSGAWSESMPSPPIASSQQHLMCTAGGVTVVVADPQGPTKALVYDDAAAEWSETELPVSGAMVTAVADSTGDQVLVIEPSGGAARFTPSTLEADSTEAPQDPDRFTPIVALGGDRFGTLVGGATPTLELVR